LVVTVLENQPVVFCDDRAGRADGDLEFSRGIGEVEKVYCCVRALPV